MMQNPYYRNDFFQFLMTLCQRLWLFITGEVSLDQLVTDEIQMVVLIGIAISSALVGSFLILRRMTMLANALSHTILLGIVIAYLITHPEVFSGQEVAHEGHDPINLTAMLIGAFSMGIVTTFLTEFLTKTARLQEDASIGLVFTSLFALGVVLITLFTRNAHVGTEIVIGNVDALHIDDIQLVWAVVALNSVLFAFLFKEYQITTFDRGLAQALGYSTMFFNYLLMIQVAATAIGAFRAVGVLMVLAFMTAPPLTARLLTHDLKRMLILSVLIGAVAAVTGVALSRHVLSIYGTPLSTAGIVVCCLVVLFTLAVLFSPSQGVIANALRRRRLRSA